MKSHFFWEKKLFRKSASNLICVLRQTSSKCKFRRAPPIRYRIGGGTLLICISTKNGSEKKFLHQKLLDNICSSGLKKNYQTKGYTCEFENFWVQFFSHLCLLLEGFVPQMKFQHTFLTRLNYFPRENTLSCHVKIFFDVKKTSGNQTITIRKTKSFHFLIFQKSEFWGLEEVCLKTEIWIWQKNAFLTVFMNLWFFPKWKGICQKRFIMLEKNCWHLQYDQILFHDGTSLPGRITENKFDLWQYKLSNFMIQKKNKCKNKL